MHLREGEEILKTYRHHPTPFVWMMLKIVIYFAPFYAALFLSSSSLSTQWVIILHVTMFAIFALIVIYLTLIYWLDKLIITNQRIIYVDYKFLTVSHESQAFIWDIQDIITHEKGILSYIRFFDYGTIRMETAAANVTITFEDAPDPEGIRQFIFHIRRQ